MPSDRGPRRPTGTGAGNTLGRQALEGFRAAHHHRPAPRAHQLRAAGRLVLGLLALVTGGTLLLLLPISSTRGGLSWDAALFTAVSALSTTGLSVITPGSDLSLFGQCVLMLLMQMGGVGFMVGAVVIFRLLGRRITLEERIVLRDSLGLLSTQALLRLTRNILFGVLLIEGVGVLALWLAWRGAFGDGRAAYYALFHAVSAFSNASFDLFSGAPDAPAGFPTDAATLLTISTLIILGSIGIPVIADMVRWPRRRALSLHTRLTLITAGALLLIGTIGMFLGESKPGVLFSDAPWPRRLLLGYFHSASSRTSGFVLQPFETMHPSSVLLLTTLMFIGGSPASMGGGITTSTFAVLVLGMSAFVRGEADIRVGNRTLPHETLIKAAAIVTIALLLVIISSWLLLITHNTTFDRAVFEIVSAFSTCGFTLGLTPELNLFGRLLVAFTMFWERLGPLTLVVALAQRERTAQIRYPEEPILIG